MAKRKLIAEYNVFLTDDGRLEIDYVGGGNADRMWIAQEISNFACEQIKDCAKRLEEEVDPVEDRLPCPPVHR